MPHSCYKVHDVNSIEKNNGSLPLIKIHTNRFILGKHRKQTSREIKSNTGLKEL